jgi:stage IV sporulation protein A
VLFEFPVKSIAVNIPHWLAGLEKDHWLRSIIFSTLKKASSDIKKIREVSSLNDGVSGCEFITRSNVDSINLGNGGVRLSVDLQPDLFYQILGEKTGLDIGGEAGLLKSVLELAEIKKKYDKIAQAIEEVEATGYGIVMPSIDELTLEKPELMKQGNRYGVKLRASAPSIHMLKADITTEVAPIVGSEKQSEELVMYLLKDFEENPAMIWESNIFGKSLHELVNEGLHNKLYKMPSDARGKLQETIERVINEGCSGLICIII